jgi:hypothetical protein
LYKIFFFFFLEMVHSPKELRLKVKRRGRELCYTYFNLT